MPADPCPICRRPIRALGTSGPLVEARCCPRFTTLPTSADLECLRLGIAARDALIAENVEALRQRDELLARAREVLVDTEAKVTAALEQLDREST